MEETYELKYHRLEESNWWFVARRDIMFRLIKKLKISKDNKVLEVGCSGCSFIKFLNQKGIKNAYGIDTSKKAINLCKKRDVKNAFVMDATKTKFSYNEFDILIASDVLEHIKDDSSALKEWNRILKPNGTLILFVPAFNLLWSMHDKINFHYRRYSKTGLKKALRKNNFDVKRASYWNFSLFFPALFARAFQRIFSNNKIHKDDQLYDLNSGFNRILTALLKFENRILSYINFPFGISVFAVARKK